MNLANLIKSLIFMFFRSKTSEKSTSSPKPAISDETREALKEAEEASKAAESARKEADSAKKEAEEAKEDAIKRAELARLDAQIEALKASLPKKPYDAKECAERYGAITVENDKVIWKDEAKWCAILAIPEDIAQGWINTATGKPTLRIYSNKDIHRPLILALLLLKRRGLLSELKTFDGCFIIRKQRGGDSVSYHSWAIAIDLNAKENPLGKKPVLSPEFVQCWKEAGWTWGGDWTRPDGQHFQYVTRG